MKLNLEIDKKFRELRTIISFLRTISDGNYGKINKKIKSKLEDIQELLEASLVDSNIYLQSLTDQVDSLSKIKEEFINNINDQTRIPLTVLQGTLDFLIDSIDDIKKSDILKRIYRMKRAIEDLSQLIYALLDTSNFENKTIKANIQEIDLTALILSTLNHHKKRYRDKEIEVKINSPKTPIIIKNDFLHMSKVLSVFIKNAFMFTEEGHIEITHHFDKNNQNKVIIKIQDTGIGISEKETKKIFKIFTKGKIHSREGIGLGLYIANKFLKLHGGKIEINSQVNRGSTFKISLPLCSKYKDHIESKP